MTRSRSHVPKHCHHKAKNLGYVRLDGRALYTGKWGSEAAERKYKRLIREWLGADQASPTRRAGEPYLIEDLIADYWVHAQGYYRKDGQPTREVANIRYALRPLLGLFGDLPVEDFGPIKLRAYRDQLIDQGLCRNLINQRVGIVKRVVRWGVAEEKLPSSFAEALRCLPGLKRGRSAARETEPVKPVNESDMRAVLPFLSRQVAGMVELQWLTGMRPGEVVQLRLADIDRSGQVWLYRPQSHKTVHLGRERVVPLGPQAQRIIKRFPRLDQSAPLFSPAEAESERRVALRKRRKSKATPSQQARRRETEANPKRRLNPGYTSTTYRQAVTRACDRVGIERWSPNQLRHAAATRLRKRFGLETARVVLGHASADVTEVYAEVDQAKAFAVMQECG